MAQTNALAGTVATSSIVSVPASSSGSCTSDDGGHKIQISIGVPQPTAGPSGWAAAADHVLAAPLLWTVACFFFLIAWRKDLRRLLAAVIHRIESGDKIEFGGMKMESPTQDPPIYTVILDEEGSKNGLDME